MHIFSVRVLGVLVYFLCKNRWKLKLKPLVTTFIAYSHTNIIYRINLFKHNLNSFEPVFFNTFKIFQNHNLFLPRRDICNNKIYTTTAIQKSILKIISLALKCYSKNKQSPNFLFLYERY